MFFFRKFESLESKLDRKRVITSTKVLVYGQHLPCFEVKGIYSSYVHIPNVSRIALLHVLPFSVNSHN